MYDQEGRNAVSREDLVNAFHSMRRAMGGIRLDTEKGEPESAEDLKGIVKYVNDVFEKITEIRKDSPTDPIHTGMIHILLCAFFFFFFCTFLTSLSPPPLFCTGYMSFADFKTCVKYHPLVIEVGSVFLADTCQPLFNTPDVSSMSFFFVRSFLRADSTQLSSSLQHSSFFLCR